MKKKISAKVVADSVNTHGNRVTTLLVTFPRFILAELNTHRMFSKNSASSRAIPFEKMIKMVKEDPFIPIAWQKNHKGMQGTEYFTEKEDIDYCIKGWLLAAKDVTEHAIGLNEELEITKQLVNRLLEPFMWHTVLVTSTEWENFFNLRCPQYQTPVSQTIEPQRSWKDLINNHSNPINLDKLEENKNNWAFKMQHSLSGAEIHMQALAEAMWDAMNESTPKLLNPGEWHTPFVGLNNLENQVYFDDPMNVIKISVARAARLSYMTFDGEINYEKDIQLHDTLLKSGHMSPFEHCCKVMSDLEYYSYIKGKYPTGIEEFGNIYNKETYPFISNHKSNTDWISFEGENPNNKDIYGWCDNFRGFISYRHLLNERN